MSDIVDRPILDIQDLRFELQGLQILNGVNLSVRQGETVGIIGPNGSGKTTLFNCLSGFNRHTGGKIIFQGNDISRMSASRRAAVGLGRVFQNCGVFREMTLLENMLVALESKRPLWSSLVPWLNGARQNRHKALKMLRDVGLKLRAHKKASSLSGGQMRLLEIARTLAFGAELFMLDEPTAGVSPKMKGEVARLIMHLQSLKKTVLLIEHDIVFIQQFCDRIVVLDEGQVVLDGNPKEVREHPMLQEIYFGGNGSSNHSAKPTQPPAAAP